MGLNEIPIRPQPVPKSTAPEQCYLEVSFELFVARLTVFSKSCTRGIDDCLSQPASVRAHRGI